MVRLIGMQGNTVHYRIVDTNLHHECFKKLKVTEYAPLLCYTKRFCTTYGWSPVGLVQIEPNQLETDRLQISLQMLVFERLKH